MSYGSFSYGSTAYGGRGEETPRTTIEPPAMNLGIKIGVPAISFFNGVLISPSAFLIDILMRIPKLLVGQYRNRYSEQDTFYANKFVKQNNVYVDKFAEQGNVYQDKFIKQDNVYSEKHTKQNTKYQDKF